MDLFGSALDFLIDNAEAANLIAAAAVLIIGGLYLLANKEPLKTHVFASHAMWFWTLQWFASVIFYSTLVTFESIPLWLELSFVDLHSVLLVGFSISYIAGPNPRTVRNWIGIAGALVLFVGFALAMEALVDSTHAGSAWRYLWIGPSFLLSIVCFFLFGVAFLLRYGRSAFVIAVVSIGYLLLQWPIYTSVVVRLSPDRRWFLALAFAKLVFGGLFYIYFFTPLESYPSFSLESGDEVTRRNLKRKFVTLGKAAAGFGAAILAGVISAWLWENARN